MLGGYICVTASTNKMTEMLLIEQVCWIYDANLKNVLFFFFNIALMSFIDRAIFNDISNSSITSTRTADIAQSTATTGNLMKMMSKNGMECRGGIY